MRWSGLQRLYGVLFCCCFGLVPFLALLVFDVDLSSLIGHRAVMVDQT